MVRDHTEGAAPAWTHEEEGMFPPQRICCILYPCLQLQKPAAEHNEEARAAFRMHMGENYWTDQLVFVDETGVNRNTSARRYGWAPCGDRARRRDFFIRGTKFVQKPIQTPTKSLLRVVMLINFFLRYSVLPALSMHGILHVDIQHSAYTADSFNNFIGGLLLHMNPFPGPRSVLVMDNTSIHKSEELVEMCQERYVQPPPSLH